MLPKQFEIELPLLLALKELGGSAKPSQVYGQVTKHFPHLTQADLTEQLASGGNKWTNRIQWVRQALVDKGELASPSYGVWAITQKGLDRLSSSAKPQSSSTVAVPTALSATAPATAASTAAPSSLPVFNLEEYAEDYLSSFRQKVLQKLHDLSPAKFEEFAGALLHGYGFQKISVTGKTGDGGIDGHGQLKVGLASLKAAFQCKRWKGQNPVGAKEVQAFRGAIQGQFEQGYFFTTSRFTKSAQDESIKMGAAPIILFDGEQIVEIMIEKGIGVKRRPVEIYEDQLEELFES